MGAGTKKDAKKDMKRDIKKDIRREILGVRDNMREEEWVQKSRLIRERMMRHPAYLSADDILCYVNYKREVETISLIRESIAAGKRVFCPLVSGKEMDFYGIDSTEELRAGFHGILEPPERRNRRFEPLIQNETVLMIMPGAVFDRAHHRIGYGGGYYDRYLHGALKIDTVALAFSFQVTDEIPHEAHDVCPRFLVTEDGDI